LLEFGKAHRHFAKTAFQECGKLSKRNISQQNGRHLCKTHSNWNCCKTKLYVWSAFKFQYSWTIQRQA